MRIEREGARIVKKPVGTRLLICLRFEFECVTFESN